MSLENLLRHESKESSKKGKKIRHFEFRERMEKNQFNVVRESKESSRKGRKLGILSFEETQIEEFWRNLWRFNSRDTIVLACCNRTVRDPTVSLYSCLFREQEQDETEILKNKEEDSKKRILN